MEVILDSTNILLNALVLGFAGALVLLAYLTLRPQTSATATQNTAPVASPESRPVFEGTERIHQTAQSFQQEADRAA